MKTWAAFALLIACFSAMAAGPPPAEPVRTEFEQNFIGREWVIAKPYEKAYPVISAECHYLTDHSHFKTQKNLKGMSIDVFLCGGRHLYLLTRTDRDFRVKSLDALAFTDSQVREMLLFEDYCELEGKTDRHFFALVRFGRSERASGKRGVLQAWMPNPETGKFEDLSTQHIACWRPTPP